MKIFGVSKLVNEWDVPDFYLNSRTPQKFTGKERDAETGLDYFGFRYLSSAQGRWTSPDPALLSVNTSNPQSLNRYAYVLNNPLLYFDPNGLWELTFLYTEDKKNPGKYIVQFQATWEKGDDGASLAKQLHLKGKEAEEFAASVDGATNVVLDSQEGEVGRVYRDIEKRFADKLSGTPNLGDCSKNAAEIFWDHSFVAQNGTGNIDIELDRRLATSVSWENASVGNLVRYADKRNDPKHFGNLIFFKKDGTPQVFSKMGTEPSIYYIGNPYSIQGERREGVDYGTIRGMTRKDESEDKSGVYKQ